MAFLRSSTQRKDATVRRATSSISGWGYLSPYRGSWNVDRAVREGYERIIWVFRAVDYIASNESRLPIVLRSGGEDGPDVTGDPLLRLLNRKSNDIERAANFRYRLTSQVLLSRKGAFVEVRYDRGGRPFDLHLLPPGSTSPIPDPDKYISGFEVIVDGKPQTVPAVDPKSGKPKVLWFRRSHPIDPYSGVTPLESAGLSCDMDWYARLYNRGFLMNDGRPGGILGVKGDVDAEDARKLETDFSGGPRNAGRVRVLEAEDLTWVDTAVTPRDAQFAEILKMTKVDILDAFGVDESCIGQCSGSTFANAEQAKLNFWTDTMPPHTDLLGGTWDEITAGGIEDDVFVVHDTVNVPVLRKAREEREKHLMAQVEAGLISRDEYREAIGRDPYEVRGTRSLWIPSKRQEILTEEDQNDEDERQAAEEERQAALGQTPEQELAAMLAEGSQDPAVDGSGPQAGKRWAKVLTTAHVRWLDRKHSDVQTRLRLKSTREGTRFYNPPGDRSLNVRSLVDPDAWASELADDCAPHLEDAEADVGTVPAGARGVEMAKVAAAEMAAAIESSSTLDEAMRALESACERLKTLSGTCVSRAFADMSMKEASGAGG